MDIKTFIEQNLDENKRRLYRTLRDLTPEELIWQPGPECNPIGLIVWHMARVEDRWLCHFAHDHRPELWIRDGWAQRLGLPEGDTGVGYTAEQVAQFQMPPLDEVQGYFDAVREAMLTYLRDLDPSELDVAPQRSPFPEIGSLPDDFTIGRMFRQLIGEYNQHLGQVGYLRGMQRGLNQ
jgi:uncharacterized damage-inducible protein DinB